MVKRHEEILRKRRYPRPREHLKESSIFLAAREMDVKITWREHYSQQHDSNDKDRKHPVLAKVWKEHNSQWHPDDYHLAGSGCRQAFSNP